MNDYTELRAKAEAATPGPWFIDEDTRPGMEWNRHIVSDLQGDNAVCFMAHSDGKDPQRDRATALFIAAASPDVVLRLIAIAEAAQAWTEARGATQMHARLLALREALEGKNG